MSRPRSAGSVFWGLILISAGAIFLMRNLGYPVPIWTGIARYWPVLLIVWGLIKLFDYARWKRAGEPGPLFGAGEVVLLIVVILAGTALTAAANLSPDFGYLFDMASINVWDITGNSYSYSEHYEKEVPQGARIEIINRYGDVLVTPSESDQLVVDVAKTIVAVNEQEADRRAEDMKYSIEEDGSQYRVISNLNRDSNRLRGRAFRTSLTIRVPRRAELTIDNRNGNVKLSGIGGEQRVTNTFGKVSLEDIDGDVVVSNKNDTVTLERIMGKATVTNEFARVEVRDIGGALDLRNQNGGVEVEKVKGDARITNSFAAFLSVKNVEGRLDIDARNTAVDVNHVLGDVSVKNQFQSITLEDIEGRADIDNRNGSVEVRYLRPPTHDLQIDHRYGDVTLILPSSSAFTLDARTQYSSISYRDFPELDSRRNGQRTSVSGQVGTGGPAIRIDNQNGAIHLEK